VQFSDGYLDAAIIKDCPRLDVLGLMFQVKDGAYVESPYVEYFKVCFLHLSLAFHAFPHLTLLKRHTVYASTARGEKKNIWHALPSLIPAVTDR
jgi:diacylglycerol kinase family enzyme